MDFVLTAVRFYAVGSYQRCVGQEYNIALGQRTVSNVVREVSQAIVRCIMSSYIKFPSTAVDRRAVASGFEETHNLADCLGFIACMHISIVTPYNNNPEDPAVGYKNRKGFPKFPGSAHDQYIFNQSNIKEEMARLTDRRIGKYY